MALINYVEPFSGGDLLAGVSVLIMVSTLSYIFYRLYLKIVQFFDVAINRAIKYEILEETFLDEIASEKGIDLNKAMIEKKIIKEHTKKRSFRNKIEEQVYERMFGKKEGKK